MKGWKTYEKAVIASVRPTLQARGFARKGALFYLETDDVVAPLWIQRNPAGESAYHFAINLGSYAESALSEDWRPFKPLKPSFGLAQIHWRLGEDAPGGDRWWLIESESQVQPCLAEIQLLLEADLPKLLSISTASGMLKYFEGGAYGGQSELGRERVMKSLRASVANKGKS